MEFPFEIQGIFPGRITVVSNDSSNSSLKIYDVESEKDSKTETSGNWTYYMTANAPWDKKVQRTKQQLQTVIDEMGLASAKAQNLHSPITTLKKLLNSDHQKLYMMKDMENPRALIGILKIGVKRLFVSDDKGAHNEVDPLCILDFYVHETKQRQGFGHLLFDSMLKTENVSPEKLAIDRPSSKFLAFLLKHYELKESAAQANNFVIFPGFFDDRPITRPPIFLYNKKGVQRANRISNKIPQHSEANSNESEALKQVQLPLSSDHLQKNRTFYSTAGNCLQWNGALENVYESPHKAKSSNAVNSCKQSPKKLSDRHSGHSERYKNGNIGWSVHDAMHSYQEVHNETNSRTTTKSSHYPIAPVNNVLKNSQQKWNQLQSSWNVLGVKPKDYSRFQNKEFSGLKSSIIASKLY